jgi:peptide-methionine (S)-S-oxide reductase
VAGESRNRLASSLKDRIVTALLPYERFYLAEDYHQKYRLRGSAPVLDAYERIYPDLNDFVSSSAVAKVNGYLGGYGSCDQLEREIDDLGLSGLARDRLFKEVCGGSPKMSCPSGGCGS